MSDPTGASRRSVDIAELMPDDLRRRLSIWIDLDSAGTEGFWRWLSAVLPLLLPAEARVAGPPGGRSGTHRLWELARELAECAGDRARLTADCARYYSDNQLLSRRVKALESMLRTTKRAGGTAAWTEDDAAGAATGRYLPGGPA